MHIGTAVYTFAFPGLRRRKHIETLQSNTTRLADG
jgi:hypothetical protein